MEVELVAISGSLVRVCAQAAAVSVGVARASRRGVDVAVKVEGDSGVAQWQHLPVASALP